MKKLLRQFEGLSLTALGEWVFVVVAGLFFWGTLWGAYWVGGVA